MKWQTTYKLQCQTKSKVKFALPLEPQTIILQIELVRISDTNKQQNGHSTPPPVKHFQLIISPDSQKQSNQNEPENSETADSSNQGSSMP